MQGINLRDLVLMHEHLVGLRREAARLDLETSSGRFENVVGVVHGDDKVPVPLTDEQRTFVRGPMHAILCSGLDEHQLERILNAVGLSLGDTMCYDE